MIDQKEIRLYISRPSWRSWRTRRLLRRRGYSFELIDATQDTVVRGWLAQLAGRKAGRKRRSVPYVFVDHRPVGGFGEIKLLEHSGVLEHLVRGEV
jgi:glutaredoxin